MSFRRIPLQCDLELYLNSTPKFETNLLQLFVERPLDEYYSLFALLPQVLKRGSLDYPGSQQLAGLWDDLHGASFLVNVHKLGDCHLLQMQLELVNQRYVDDRRDLLQEGISTLAGLLLDPVLEDGHLRAAYVEQEKEAQIRAIKGIFGDKYAYADKRVIEEMFAGEAYARHRLGQRDEVAQVTPAQLYRFYQQVLQGGRVRLLVSGDIQAEHLAAICESAFGGKLAQPVAVAAGNLKVPRATVKHVVEPQDVNQGQLRLGYTSGIGYADKLYPAAVVYNGILGAYDQSKLFLNLRAKTGVAYSVYSSLLPDKGAMMISAGIGCEQFDQAIGIIEAQLEAMRRGEFTVDEFHWARQAIHNHLRAMEERPQLLGFNFLQYLVVGVEHLASDLGERIDQVTAGQIVEVAGALRPDTVYFLRDGDN